MEELFSCLNVNEIFTDGEDGLYVKYRDEFNKHYGIKQIRGKNQKFLDDRILNMVGNSIIWEGKALYVADNDFPRNTVMASDSAEPLIIIENGKELTKVGDGFVIADYASDGLRLVNHEGEACIRVGIFDAISFVKPIKDNICKVYGVKDGQAICVTVDIMEPVSEEDLSN